MLLRISCNGAQFIEFTQPIDTVPALRHYRLVHESQTNTVNSTVDVKYVKIFEYVKGAHIKGTGIIDIPLVTNQDRNFTYLQESINGEFIVRIQQERQPVSGESHGPYHIEGTSTTFGYRSERSFREQR